jgi:hypothetical protein
MEAVLAVLAGLVAMVWLYLLLGHGGYWRLREWLPPAADRESWPAVVALVPARGGSKTVPGKNLRDLGGKPLAAWPIDVANETGAIDRVCVTTDDDDITAAAREHGADVIERPDRLATDDALVIDAIRHAIATMRADGVVHLPFRPRARPG